MPTISRIGPYRLYFYSGDRMERPHVHVERDAATVKIWLEPIGVAYNHGFPAAELRQLRSIIAGRRQVLVDAWHEHFGL